MKRSRATVSAHETDAERSAEARAALYLVLDAHRPLGSSSRILLDDLDEVEIVRAPRERRLERGSASLKIGLADEQVSSLHARLARTDGDWVVTDQRSKNGTFVNGDRVATCTLADGDVVETGRTFFLFRLQPLPASVEDVESDDLRALPAGLATLNPRLAEAFTALTKMARTGMAILIQGETGTGKEVVAKAIHGLSARKGPLVSVNCGALAENLLESELFGSRKGAFSGAEDRQGLIRAANGGTVFLDEIGEMSPAMQVKLLRVLQEREVVPVGGTEAFRVDVRFIAATHRDLDAAVEEERFREDLFGRLAGYELRLPPLRERREDLGILIGALLARFTSEEVTFDVKAARALLVYAWPRNVRELEQALGRAVGLAGGMLVKPKHLPDRIANGAPTVSAGRTPAGATAAEAPRSQRPSRKELAGTLVKHGWNIAAVAAHYGKDPRQIRRWLEQYELTPEK